MLTGRTSRHCSETEPRQGADCHKHPSTKGAQSGAPAGLPLFMQESGAAASVTPAVQRQPAEEEELLQGKFAANRAATRLHGGGGEGGNHNGLPRPLKAGLETLSGMDLSGVRVHRDSSKPAQLNALAYTQGQDIHVGPGQEKHLPHEGWHAVQQAQGRVKPTVQAKSVSINDESSLEREADVMGAKALRTKRQDGVRDGSRATAVQSPAVQRQAAAGNELVTETKPQQENSRVEALRQRALTPSALRAALAADPSLGAAIQAFFAMGNNDPQLNSLLALAYPQGGRAATANESADKTEQAATLKGGTGAGAVLPPARTGNKPLTKGTYKWSLTPLTSSSPQFKADFKPDHTKVEAKAVSFAQIVIAKLGAKQWYGGATLADPTKNKAAYDPFRESTKNMHIDFHEATENDPFYGAEWDQANKKWKKEATAGSAVGSSTKGVVSTLATMQDPPDAAWAAREGKGDIVTEFETVPTVLETREPLGALKWGFKIEDKPDAPLELTGAQDADCTDAPSAEWGKALDKFYEARFETILDNFDIAKYDLKPDHKTKLDGVVAKMKAAPALNAQLGGAADLTGSVAFNQKLALDRAKAARDYLVGKGIPAGSIQIQSYGFDWARVEAERGTSEGKNRRVQVWLR